MNRLTELLTAKRETEKQLSALQAQVEQHKMAIKKQGEDEVKRLTENGEVIREKIRVAEEKIKGKCLLSHLMQISSTQRHRRLID